MERWFAVIGCVAAATGIAAGAFGAHALRGALSEQMLGVFETGARYQMYHALALVLVGLACARGGEAGRRAALWAGWACVAGVVLFCGSLYAMALTGVRGLGAITPIGGAAFIGGWLLLGWHFLRYGRGVEGT